VIIRAFALDDDLDALRDLRDRAFGPQTAKDAARWLDRTRPVIADGRYLGVFEKSRLVGPAAGSRLVGAAAGSRLVGAAGFHDMTEWWRGRAVPMAGVAGVAVAPEERGKGIGRAVMTALLDLIAARGYPLSVLYPATSALYRSLGWEIAGGAYEAAVPARSLRSLVPPDVPAETPGAPDPHASRHAALRRAGPGDAAEVIAALGQVHAATGHCGPVTRDEDSVRRLLDDGDVYAYLADDGFLAYHWERVNGVQGIFVRHLAGVTELTTRTLWGIVASHSSFAATVRAVVGPADPVSWLTREPDVKLTRTDMWMLRVVDAPAAIAARGFPPAAELTLRLRVTDDARPGNSGPWTLHVHGGRGSLSPYLTAAAAVAPRAGTRPAAADLTLGARGLAALYAGTPMASLRRAGLAAGGDPGEDAALDTAFGATPFLLDFF
jgi:predicted acetyltransferase